MGLLYKITKWGVNRLIKKNVDLSNLVEVDKTTKLLNLQKCKSRENQEKIKKLNLIT